MWRIGGRVALGSSGPVGEGSLTGDSGSKDERHGVGAGDSRTGRGDRCVERSDTLSLFRDGGE